MVVDIQTNERMVRARLEETINYHTLESIERVIRTTARQPIADLINQAQVRVRHSHCKTTTHIDAYSPVVRFGLVHCI